MQKPLRKQDCRIFEFADFRVEMAERVLKRQGQLVSLRPKLFDLLVFLLEHRGVILEKDEITSAVWGGLSQGSADHPSANLTVNISNLRHALGDDSERPMFIETVPYRGYRFIALVRVEEATQAKPVETRLAVMSAASGGGHQMFSSVAEAAAGKAPAARLEAAAESQAGPAADIELPARSNQTSEAPLVSKTAALWQSSHWKLIAVSAVLAGAVWLVWAMAAQRNSQAAKKDSLSGSARPPVVTENNAAALPRIDAIEPASPTAWIGDKVIKVRGFGFQPGLSVMMLFPGGGSATLSGTQLLDVQPDEFTMLVDFNNNPGEYRIRIHSPEDLHSDWFVFDVSPISLLPQITDIKQIGFIEGSPTKARVDIIGSNFLQHAHAVLFYPDGQTEYLTSSRITSGLFQVTFDLRGMTGPFRLQIQNAGKGSNLFSFSISKP
ncbi:MAG TPA: transcriptional regulator [Blastocatellia bacterium]|nr:transcriptional regulator [Blastocatellia bacterium]HMY71783.1 transcriptional regulator [Blastocatellia bacterium]HMZ19087.1 transcriptional regulator [Blastocatellia bacterium]HNG30279.1 transcriptional regulator [Blastocatellia bacterium]